jgi:hypothetical protein
MGDRTPATDQADLLDVLYTPTSDEALEDLASSRYLMMYITASCITQSCSSNCDSCTKEEPEPSQPQKPEPPTVE